MDRSAALDAALTVFFRYGYRKSSMEDLARAIGVSRQWVYQRFESKERLFVDALDHALEGALERARAALEADGSLEDRLVNAFDGWCGVVLESASGSAHAQEILDEAVSAHAPAVGGARDRFLAMLAGALADGLPGLPCEGGVTPASVASVLLAVSDSLKHSWCTRDRYLEGIRDAARVVIAGRRGGAVPA